MNRIIKYIIISILSIVLISYILIPAFICNEYKKGIIRNEKKENLKKYQKEDELRDDTIIRKKNNPESNPEIKIIDKYLNKNQFSKPKEILFVSIKKQKIFHVINNKIISKYIISSSEYGEGNNSGSNQTPLGLHLIREKIGDDVPLNGKLIGRKFYGKIAKVYFDTTRSITDDVTSRILWLEGMEEGVNKGQDIDSYKRYIYIHGTSEEGRLGSKSSHGCIRMKNKEIIDLYNVVKVGTLVLIL